MRTLQCPPLGRFLPLSGKSPIGQTAPISLVAVSPCLRSCFPRRIEQSALESSIKGRRVRSTVPLPDTHQSASRHGFTVKEDRLKASAPYPSWGLHVDRAQRDGGELNLALAYLRKALTKLDQEGAPAQIGAHIDLAVHQLQEFVSGDPEGPGMANIRSTRTPNPNDSPSAPFSRSLPPSG